MVRGDRAGAMFVLYSMIQRGLYISLIQLLCSFFYFKIIVLVIRGYSIFVIGHKLVSCVLGPCPSDSENTGAGVPKSTQLRF